MKKNIKNQIKEKDLDKVNGGARKINPILNNIYKEEYFSKIKENNKKINPILKPGLPEPVKKIGKNELPLSPESINDNGHRIDS